MPTPNLLAQRLAVLQSFKESTWGTSGSATAKWTAVRPYPEFKPYRKITAFDEARGSLAPAYSSALLRKGGEFKIPGYVTFEDAVLLGSGFWATGSASGSVAPYTWNFTGATTPQPSLTSFTFEFNQATAAVLATGCIANKLQIKGSENNPLEYELTGFAQDVDAGTGSSISALADRTVEIAVFLNTSIYMDPSGSTIGTTAFPNAITSFVLDLENALRPIYTAGSLTPTGFVAGDRWKTALTLDLLYTAAVKTFITGTLMTGTRTLVRLRNVSGAKSINLDFAGVLADDPTLFGNKDGAQLIQVKLDGIYDVAAALHANMSVVNTVAALP